MIGLMMAAAFSSAVNFRQAGLGELSIGGAAQVVGAIFITRLEPKGPFIVSYNGKDLLFEFWSPRAIYLGAQYSAKVGEYNFGQGDEHPHLGDANGSCVIEAEADLSHISNVSCTADTDLGVAKLTFQGDQSPSKKDVQVIAPSSRAPPLH